MKSGLHTISIILASIGYLVMFVMLVITLSPGNYINAWRGNPAPVFAQGRAIFVMFLFSFITFAAAEMASCYEKKSRQKAKQKDGK